MAKDVKRTDRDVLWIMYMILQKASGLDVGNTSLHKNPLQILEAKNKYIQQALNELASHGIVR